MTNIPKCGIHGTPMVLKPAGTSKAGKPYPAFWTCGTKNPDGTWCAYKPPKEVSTSPNQPAGFEAGLNQYVKDEQVDKRDKKREEGMSWGNAKSNATQVVISFFEKGLIKGDEFKTKYEEIANWIYKLEPRVTIDDLGTDAGYIPVDEINM